MYVPVAELDPRTKCIRKVYVEMVPLHLDSWACNSLLIKTFACVLMTPLIKSRHVPLRSNAYLQQTQMVQVFVN